MKAIIHAMAFSFVLLLGGGAQAHVREGKMEAMEKMTPEQRQKMADLHSKMAECLKSDKAVGECHSEMASNCEKDMGKDYCPMKGMHKAGWKKDKAKKGASMSDDSAERSAQGTGTTTEAEKRPYAE